MEVAPEWAVTVDLLMADMAVVQLPGATALAVAAILVAAQIWAPAAAMNLVVTVVIQVWAGAMVHKVAETTVATIMALPVVTAQWEALITAAPV